MSPPVEQHVPRLRAVSASLKPRSDSLNRFSFVITDLLKAWASVQPVNFNAVLQPSALHCPISKAARTVRA